MKKHAQAARGIKCFGEVAHVDPLAAAGTAAEVVGFVLRRPALADR